MTLLYKGKTKDVYQNSDGNYTLYFKDDVTGTDGVFDPGANTIGLSIEGAGVAGLRLTQFFYEKINAAGIPTHFISADPAQRTMVVRPAQVFGKGVEVILRYRAVGSFLRRYGRYCIEGQELNGYVEVTLKDDERNDPLITAEGLEMLGIMNQDEYRNLGDLTRKIGAIVKAEMAKKELELYDIKFEFGRVGSDGQIALIDEISGGNMRAYRGKEYIQPLDLEKIMLA
jgi:phosphoribosylaminoimidazole-succinocarboxamide synthase